MYSDVHVFTWCSATIVSNLLQNEACGFLKLSSISMQLFLEVPSIPSKYKITRNKETYGLGLKAQETFNTPIKASGNARYGFP